MPKARSYDPVYAKSYREKNKSRLKDSLKILQAAINYLVKE